MRNPKGETELRATLWAVALLALSCTEDPIEQYAPVSEACDACLSRAEADGCAVTWNACVELAECEQQVLCELRAGCYAEPEQSQCSEDAGCALADGASEQVALASAEFESCARTTCATGCGFVAP